MRVRSGGIRGFIGSYLVPEESPHATAMSSFDFERGAIAAVVEIVSCAYDCGNGHASVGPKALRWVGLLLEDE